MTAVQTERGHSVPLEGFGGDSHSVGPAIVRQALTASGGECAGCLLA